MKHLCFSKKIFVLFLLFVVSLQAALTDKSAIVYLGKKISYPMVGIHNYILVDPKNTNVYTHGFDVYKDKMYAKMAIDKKDNDENLLVRKVDRLANRGFKNFFFEIKQGVALKDMLVFFNLLKSFPRYEKSKIMISSNNKMLLTKLHSYADSLLVYNISKNIASYQNIIKLKDSVEDIIDVEFVPSTDIASSQDLIKRIKSYGVIPYITTQAMDIYGKSSKNADKREILTIIDDSVDDRIVLSAHQYGAMPLEYQGYIQTLYDIKQGLPNPDKMTQYAGVVIWLNVENDKPEKLISWVNAVAKRGIYVAFADNFGFSIDDIYLAGLGISISDGEEGAKKTVIHKDKICDFEIEMPLNKETLYFHPPKGSKALFSYKDSNGETSTPAAITPWGGYAISDAFMLEIDGQNIWTIDPFKYFKKALRLKTLPVPDPTTENGNRIFFSHIDGDGIMNSVEFNPELVSGDTIYSDILKPIKLPHSVSVIGAEIMPNGLYPKLSPRLMKIAKKMFALENVEPATHTFTHPFFWGKIKNDNLSPEYRLKPKGYHFSLAYELKKGTLDFIQKHLIAKNSKKKAQTVYWSGDCAPRVNALSYIYKHHILNINGGDTTINNSEPWLTLVAPLGLQRDEYYQIYTGQQNENVFTNDWLGPFWGFKKVTQTFELTDSPRRLKPIDIYYHQYSGSKKASLNALKYAFAWALKHEITPLFASEYIPQAMDYFTVSMADNGNRWLIDGMQNLKTIRIEKKNAGVDLTHSKTTLGVKHFENHTYISLDPHKEHFITLQKRQKHNEAYLISANAIVTKYILGLHSKRYQFHANVDLKLEFNLPKNCTIKSKPRYFSKQRKRDNVFLVYKANKEATVDVLCK